MWLLVLIIIVIWLVCHTISSLGKGIGEAGKALGSAAKEAMKEDPEAVRAREEKDREIASMEGDWYGDYLHRAIIRRGEYKRIGYMYKITEPGKYAGVYIADSKHLKQPDNRENLNFQWQWLLSGIKLEAFDFGTGCDDPLHSSDGSPRKVWKLTEEELEDIEYIYGE